MVLLQRDRQDREDLVAVDEVALVVDDEAAIGVACERDAQVRALLDDADLEVAHVGRAAAVVDVDAVGPAWIGTTCAPCAANASSADIEAAPFASITTFRPCSEPSEPSEATRWAT